MTGWRGGQTQFVMHVRECAPISGSMAHDEVLAGRVGSGARSIVVRAGHG